MGILEIIANPNVTSPMERLQYQNMREDRQYRRRLRDLQLQQTQQEIGVQTKQAQGRRQGRDVLAEASDAIKDIPAERLEQMDYGQVGRELAPLPGMQEPSQFYLELDLKAKEHARKQSKHERQAADELYERTAVSFLDVAKFTDAKQFNRAKQLYEQTIGFILNDPRVKDNQEVYDFFNSIQEYQPGLAKFVYTTTRSAKKARDETSPHQLVLEQQAGRRADIAERGLEIREEMLADKQYNQRIKTTTGLRTEYSSQTGEISGALSQIALARKALETGNPLSKKMAQATLSRVANSKVRALAELNQYKNFGNLQGRVSGWFSEILLGDYSIKQKKMALETLDEIEAMYKEMQGEAKDYFHYLAEEGKLDSHAVAKYASPEEVVANPYLSDEQKMEVLRRAFPKEFPE